MRPFAAPGDAATPRAITSYVASGSKVGCSSASSLPASIVAIACGAREQALLDGVDGEAHRRLRGALGAARLQHVQAPLLDRELGVLHVAVVALERAQDLQQLGVRLGHPVRELAQVARGAHAGDDVLALGVREEVAARLRAAVDLVAAERHARPAGLALVAVDHLLHVDGGAPVVGDAVLAAVLDGARAHPRVEDGAHRAVELLARVLREVVEAAEGRDELTQRVRRRARCRA